MDQQEVIQLAAIGFVTGGAAALTPGVCTLLREGLEREATDPARLAQATAAVELLVRTGQSLEPMVSIARTFKAERDTARQQAHAYYNQSQATQQQVAVAKARLDGQNQAPAEWERERAELQAEVARLREQNEELEAKLEKVREQRDGATRELSMLEAQLKWMAGARRH
ncbi:hypothetical protein COHA_002822 [Chlorella ohadii]|uniref:Uncharacterized protein n=1 Tax=Chlorella ohadii TaxID=2649997 RepID=A0AAD5DT81_9CHLO|nr:hypothetical protein COHA_002822 [Chlorella ohadii]